MTPEERACTILNDRVPFLWDGRTSLRLCTFIAEELESRVATAIRGAEAAMKERCAETVESFGTRSSDDAPGVVKAAAAAIRNLPDSCR